MTALTPEQRIAALEAELAKLRDSECDKIMAMSEEQITALTRMQGSNPDDVAKLGRMTFDLALKDVALQRLEAELAACMKDAERYRWLTEKAYVGIAPYPKPHEVWCLRLPNPKSFNNFDAAIDAAIAAQKQK